MNYELLEDARNGLRQWPKTLPCKWFYDERGSRIFEEICELPEYYPTRTESQILRENIAEIAARLGEEITLIEFGSGASLKTRILLENCDVKTYVPLDISAEILEASAAKLRKSFPKIEILPREADYSRPFSSLLENVAGRNRVIFFPGSTIGNFESREAAQFLENVGQLGEKMLIGADLRKNLDVLLPAYNDHRGVTARFNLNILERLNREIGADFAPEKWRHEAIWDEEPSRIEMRLVSRENQTVSLGGETVWFGRGEWIVTEWSHKYSDAALAGLAHRAFWCVEKNWSDPKNWFAVQLWRAC